MRNASDRVPFLPRAAHVLAAVCAAAIAWAVVIALSGGFDVQVGTFRLSSRRPLNPLLVAAACAVLLGALPRLDPRLSLRTVARRWMHPAAVTVLIGTGLLVSQWEAARPLWLDEQMIALNIRERPLAEMTQGLWLGQSAPFAWLAAQRGVVLWLGDGDRVMRLVPVLLAIATLVTTLWIGRRWMSAPGGLVLALLMSFGQWVSFYSLELKHYSADVLFALALPAGVAWAIEAADRAALVRRIAAWWALAAAAQWLSNGALLVTPGCAVVLLVAAWRRAGWRTAAYGLLWLAAFVVHYAIALRHALADPFLSAYWTFAYPPPASGLLGSVAWFAGQLRPFALKPGGTGFGLLLWAATLAGLALTRHRVLGLAYAAVPAAALLLAGLRLVPFFERLSLWVVPAMYVGVALLCDIGVRIARGHGRMATLVRLPVVAVLIAATATLAWDIASRGNEDRRIARPADSNHQLNDRGGVRWLLEVKEPGDALVTTQLAVPAVWWYGRSRLGAGETSLPDGTPIVLVGVDPTRRACENGALGALLAGRRRALVYFGFRFDDVPRGFDDLLLDSLSAFGDIIAVQRFTSAGSAAIVQLRRESQAVAGPNAISRDPRRNRPPGCLTARPAAVW